MTRTSPSAELDSQQRRPLARSTSAPHPPSPDYGAMIDKAGAEGQAKTSPTGEGLSDEVVSGPAPARADLPPGYHLDSEQLDLQKLGCSD
jgi:hypothetical protein